MRDRDIVAAIVAGDPAGLGAAYDGYAARLHAYCRSLLAEPADAADAVQDTFVIASAKLAGLRDPDRLQPWLYAVARNECHRRLRARAAAAPLDEAGELIDESPGVGSGAERVELAALVQSALAGLNAGDREIIELNLRHELDGAGLAAVLGVPRNQAHALASRARSQFEASLGALLVARTGRQHCPDLDRLLAGWDGRFTLLLRKRVNRHIKHCVRCGDRKLRELSPAALLSLLPAAALPPGLRAEVLHLVADTGPIAAAYREGLVRRAGDMGVSGFPAQIRPPNRAGVSAGRAITAGAGALTIAALGGAVFLSGLLHAPPGGSNAAAGPPAAAPPSAAPPSARPPSSQPASSSPAPSSPAPSSQPSAASPGPAGPASPAGTSALAATGSHPGVPSGSSSPAAGSSGASPSPAPAPTGTLSASPLTVVLTQSVAGVLYSGTFTLTAQGGAVPHVSITNVTGPLGDLSIIPSATSVPAGHTITVHVTAVSVLGLASLTELTVSPGGLTVAVTYAPA